MRVSVIIPVYNAEKYVAMAIDSVLAQEELLELILVEDNSPDNSLEICKEYASRDARVVLLRHPNGENRGAGASRNLGIKHAQGEFVAFLDADDQYVPNRFKTARQLFDANPDAHGVYGHIGTLYYDVEYKPLHLKRSRGEVTGLSEYVPPEKLLTYLLRGSHGHFSLDSLVVKREILGENHVFDESLRQAQDTDFLFRLAGSFRLYSAKQAEIVAMRGVHSANRVFRFDEALKYRQKVLRKCIRHRFYGCSSPDAAMMIIKRYLDKTPLMMSHLKFLSPRIKRKVSLLIFLVIHPGVVNNLIGMKFNKKNR